MAKQALILWRNATATICTNLSGCNDAWYFETIKWRKYISRKPVSRLCCWANIENWNIQFTIANKLKSKKMEAESKHTQIHIHIQTQTITCIQGHKIKYTTERRNIGIASFLIVSVLFFFCCVLILLALAFCFWLSSLLPHANKHRSVLVQLFYLSKSSLSVWFTCNTCTLWQVQMYSDTNFLRP